MGAEGDLGDKTEIESTKEMTLDEAMDKSGSLLRYH